MTWQWIDMANSPRKAHFHYFRTLQNPMVFFTAEVDVTDLVKHCKAESVSFYLAFMHVAALAANDVPELRRRIRDGRVVEYDFCGTSHIEGMDDGSYCYCTLYHDRDWADYFPYAEEQRRRCREHASIEEDDAVEGLYFITCLPWVHYIQLMQPTAGGDESNPRISWGRYAPDWQGRLQLPVTLLCHHSLVDGIHIARFYHALAERLQQFA